MPLHPRKELAELKACQHGGLDYAELLSLGVKPEDVLDFSVCCNPYPLSRSFMKNVSADDIMRYPDSGCTELREKITQKLGIASSSILVGSGTTELIRLLTLAYFQPGDKALIPKPTYGEYETACRIAGAEMITIKAKEENNFYFGAEEIARAVKQHQPKAVFLCNPNNPTGQYFSRDELTRIMDNNLNTLFIMDEAYIAFVEKAESSLELIEKGNVIILRSMTKDYAIAGLRLGYAIASEEIISTLRKVAPPWSVNIIAQKAGLAALADSGFLERSLKKIERSKQYLFKSLHEMGFPVLPSKSNFFLARVGDGGLFRKKLMHYGMMVRDCASFGLPKYVRIAPRTFQECRRLIEIMKVLKEKGELNV